jgi:hypothetical protein
MHADIHLDDDPKVSPATLHRRTELQDMRRVVHRDDRIGVLSKLAQALHLCRSDDLVGDQDIAQAASGEHLGLTQLGTGHADRAGGEFLGDDLGRLLALGVRSPADTMRAAGLGQAGDIRFHEIEIDQQSGCVERGLRLADKRRGVSHVAGSFKAVDAAHTAG